MFLYQALHTAAIIEIPAKSEAEVQGGMTDIVLTPAPGTQVYVSSPNEYEMKLPEPVCSELKSRLSDSGGGGKDCQIKIICVGDQGWVNCLVHRVREGRKTLTRCGKDPIKGVDRCTENFEHPSQAIITPLLIAISNGDGF